MLFVLLILLLARRLLWLLLFGLVRVLVLGSGFALDAEEFI